MRRAALALVLSVVGASVGCRGGDDPAGLRGQTSNTAVPSTSLPAEPPLQLRGDGLSELPFGASESSVSQLLRSRFGEPTEFTDYLPDYCSTGEGEIGRELRWGPLVILLNNESEGGSVPADDVPPGGLYFWGYRYATQDPFTGATVTDTLRLSTETGIRLGSTTAEVEAAYGTTAEFLPGSADGFPPPRYTIRSDSDLDADLWFFNIDPRDSVVVAVIGGRGCGE